MRDENKSKEQLIAELNELRPRVAELERERAALGETCAVQCDGELNYRQLAETIKEVFWIADLDVAKIIYVSPAYEEIWGQTCESLYADPGAWTESIHPQERQKVVEAILSRGTVTPSSTG